MPKISEQQRQARRELILNGPILENSEHHGPEQVIYEIAAGIAHRVALFL